MDSVLVYYSVKDYKYWQEGKTAYRNGLVINAKIFGCAEDSQHVIDAITDRELGYDQLIFPLENIVAGRRLVLMPKDQRPYLSEPIREIKNETTDSLPKLPNKRRRH